MHSGSSTSGLFGIIHRRVVDNDRENSLSLWENAELARVVDDRLQGKHSGISQSLCRTSMTSNYDGALFQFASDLNVVENAESGEGDYVEDREHDVDHEDRLPAPFGEEPVQVCAHCY